MQQAACSRERTLRVLQTLQDGIDLSGLCASELVEVAKLARSHSLVNHSFFQDLGTHLLPVIHECTPAELREFTATSNMMKEVDTALLSRVVDCLLPNMSNASDDVLCWMLRDFAHANFHDQRFLLAFAGQFLRRTKDNQWSMRNLQFVIESLSRLNLIQKRLMQRWIKQMLSLDSRMLDRENVTKVSQSVNWFGIWNPVLMKKLRDALHQSPPSSSVELSKSTFLSYSCFGFTDGNFLHFLLKRTSFQKLRLTDWNRYRLALTACHLDNGIDFHRASLRKLSELLACFKQCEGRRTEASSAMTDEVKAALAKTSKRKWVEEGEAGPYLVDLVT